MQVHDFSPEVKIIQMLLTENNAITQGMLLGLGDDGVVYCQYSLDGATGWCVYIEDNFIKQDNR